MNSVTNQGALFIMFKTGAILCRCRSVLNVSTLMLITEIISLKANPTNIFHFGSFLVKCGSIILQTAAHNINLLENYSMHFKDILIPALAFYRAAVKLFYPDDYLRRTISRITWWSYFITRFLIHTLFTHNYLILNSFTDKLYH